MPFRDHNIILLLAQNNVALFSKETVCQSSIKEKVRPICRGLVLKRVLQQDTFGTKLSECTVTIMY